MTPNGSVTPASLAAFWWAADDVATANPATLVDRIGGAVMSPVGASGGTLEATGWGGQQKSILQDSQGWKTTAAGVVSRLTGGQNFWLMLVGMQLATNATPAVAPDQTLLSAGSSADAQKYWALQERNKVAATIGGKQFSSQRWIQRFGAAAETQDESTFPQGPFPWVWFIQVDNTGAHQLDSIGQAEQAFARSPGGALTVDTLTLGALIQGGVITADGRMRWRHLFGNSGTLTVLQQAQLYAWLNRDTAGFEKCKGIVGNWTTKTWARRQRFAQSNGQDQSTSPALTAANVYNLNYSSFVTPLAAPWCSSTGTPFASVFAGSNGNGVGMPSAFSNQMVTLGKFNPATEAMVHIPGGVGGSSMGGFWVKNLTTDPWGWDAPVGAQCLRSEYVNRNFPNVVWLPDEGYQGESETLVLVDAQHWPDANRAQLCAGAYDTWDAARGYTRKPAVPTLIVNILPVTEWTSSTPTIWLAERTSQNTLGTTFSGAVVNQVPDGDWIGGPTGNRLHIGPTAQTQRGQDMAALS